MTRRDWEKATRVPPELVGDAEQGVCGCTRPGGLRRKSRLRALRPYLETNLELRHRYIDCFDPADETYDVLLDDYEPEMKTADVRQIFDELKEELVPLIQEIGAAGDVDDSFLTGDFARSRSGAFSLEVVAPLRLHGRRMADRPDAASVHDRPGHRGHPAHDELPPGRPELALRDDARVRARRSTSAGVDPSLAADAARRAASRSACTSRRAGLWENLVGRSRPFWRCFYPRLQERFPGQLRGGRRWRRFYRAVNKVQPSLIRIEADEVTYNLHIILRFELEQELIDGRARRCATCPEAWNARMSEYLGVEVPDDAHGVLQDVHWAGGASATSRPTRSATSSPSRSGSGCSRTCPISTSGSNAANSATLREWLRENLYGTGRKFTPQETIERVTGSPIDAKPYVRYLREKLAPQAV